MRFLTLLMLLTMSCYGLDPDQICGADEIEDILGTWYTTTQEPGVQPGYYRTDSTIWILERVKLGRGGITSLDSLRVTIEHHRSDESFDPAKHGQRTTTLPANIRTSSYGVLGYGTATFELPQCDSLVVQWTDGSSYRLRRKQ